MAKEKSVSVLSLKLMAGKLPTFNLPVKVKNLDGEEFTINFTAKAQKKSEWAKVRDEYRTAVTGEETEDKKTEKAEFSFAALVGDGMKQAAELAVKCLNGWQLEDEFNVDALIALEDQCGGSLAAALQAYDAALFSGRVGN
ncbi:hypothetical protein G7048_24810 [Diaphorobacter sp. HDW4B]|uniref:phage tail assembly chaperone n=1 Tax=Diaphorobacter sp. HDW4B TaxID=2714925 RepID=UPI00140AC91D|nr:phage tail assembly chaperone [Diaphorobacter sp. HDW4B]QIL73284.1 hypothetical protein G7048_24810 [Diaphorobacter sp. HDW4B]